MNIRSIHEIHGEEHDHLTNIRIGIKLGTLDQRNLEVLAAVAGDENVDTWAVMARAEMDRREELSK
jgi:hypothetical protein